MWKWLARKGTPALFAVALVVRVIFVLTLEDRHYYYDTVHYDKAAKAILAGQGFGEGYEYSQFFRKEYALAPLYPAFLAAVYLFFGPSYLAVRLVESIIGAFLCVLICRIGQRLFGTTAGMAAGWVAAFFPHLVFLCGLLYVENLFTFLLALGVWYALRWYAERREADIAMAALMFALACLGRPVVFAFYPFLALWMIVLVPGRRRPKVASALTVAVVTLMVLAPWTIRNYLIFGKITPVSAAAEKYLGESEEFLDEQIIARLPVAGDELKVVVTSDRDGHHFDFYYNGVFDGRLRDSLKIFGNGPERFAGLMLRGGLANEVDQFTVALRTAPSVPAVQPAAVAADRGGISALHHDDFDRPELGPAWQAPEEFRLVAGTLRNTSHERSWNHLATYQALPVADSVALRWGPHAEALGVKEGGLALLLDQPGPDANGYLAWRQPTGKLLLYTIDRGAPGQEVATGMGRSAAALHDKLRATISSASVTEQSFAANLWALLRKDPAAFVLRYAGEFVHFWSPMPDRFYSQNEFTATWSLLISLVSFSPVLVFFLAGLGLVRGRGREVALLLFMILSTALIYSLFQTKVRYRMPVEPYMIVIAAHAGVVIWERLWSRRRRA